MGNAYNSNAYHWLLLSEMKKQGKRMSKIERWIVPLGLILIFVCAEIFLLGRPLSNKSILYGKDTVSHDYIFLRYGWQSVSEHGVIPLWMPYLFIGVPFIGSFCFCPFYPTAWLSGVLEFPLAFNIRYFLAFLIGGINFYFLCRSFGLGFIGSIFGGLCFMASGHLTTLVYPGHLQKVEAIVWLPLVLAGIRWFLVKGKGGYLLLAGVSFGFQLLASHTQIAFYTIQVGLLYAIWHLFIESRGLVGNVIMRRFLTFVLISGVVLFLGFAISGAQMLPGLELSVHSNRYPKVPYDEAIMGSFPPEELLEFVLPRFTGDSTSKGYGLYKGRWKERLVSDYVGAGVWFFLLIALWKRREKWRWFFGGIVVLAGLLACGRFFPLFPLFYKFVPGYAKFRSPATIMVLMTVGLVLLSASGVDWMWQALREHSVTYVRRYSTIVVLFSILLLIVGIIGLKRGGTSQGKFPFLYIATVCFSFNLLLVALLSLLLTFAVEKVWLQRLILVLLGFTMLNDLRSNDRPFIEWIDANDYHRYLYEYWADNLIKATHKGEPVRMFDLRNALINRMIARHIGTPHGYHPVGIKRYYELLRKYDFGDENFFKAFYVMYLMVKEKPDFKGLKEQEIGEQGGAKLLRLVPLQYAWVPRKIIFGDRKSITQNMPRNLNPYELCFVETPHKSGREINQNGNLTYRVKHYSDDRINIEIILDRDSWVVWSEPNFRGWQAKVDGRPQQLYTSNLLFRTLYLKSGRHQVEFLYAPFSYRLGLFLTLLTIMGVAAFLIFFFSQRCIQDKVIN